MTTELLLGGTVYSSATPDATAMAVTDGMITWVGADSVGRALHPDAEVTDLGGRFVAPGFVDSHVHLTSTGLALTGLTLYDAVSRTDCLRMIADAVSTVGEGDLIWGRGWDSSTWSGAEAFDGRFPTTADIDAIVGNRPVYLARVDEHSAVASMALRRLVVGLEDAQGYHPDEPLIAEAHHLVRGAARSLVSPASRTRAQLRALDAVASMGIVAIHENGGPDISGLDDFLAIGELDHAVEVRRYWGQAAQNTDHARELVAITGADALGGDLFIDGAVGSRTAWLLEPYHDAPDVTGIDYLSPDTVLDHLRACTEAGLQAGFHVIGDAATATVVDALDALAAEFGTPALAAATPAAAGARYPHSATLPTNTNSMFGEASAPAKITSAPSWARMWLSAHTASPTASASAAACTGSDSAPTSRNRLERPERAQDMNPFLSMRHTRASPQIIPIPPRDGTASSDQQHRQSR